MKNIKDKTIIVTGASSGIGMETAKLLAANGAKVVLSARRESKLKEIAGEIGKNAVYMKSDVSKLEDMQALVSFAKENFSKVDVLFANAGIMPGSSMSELKISDWISMIEINIKGVLNSIAAVLPEFTERKAGHIIATSSVAGTRSVPGNAVYSGTKHFVRAMLDSFRAESISEGTNIRTTVIYPGAVKTELLNTIPPSKQKQWSKSFIKMSLLILSQFQTQFYMPYHNPTTWIYPILQCVHPKKADILYK